MQLSAAGSRGAFTSEIFFGAPVADCNILVFVGGPFSCAHMAFSQKTLGILDREHFWKN